MEIKRNNDSHFVAALSDYFYRGDLKIRKSPQFFIILGIYQFRSDKRENTIYNIILLSVSPILLFVE